jgi:hypothetical protein
MISEKNKQMKKNNDGSIYYGEIKNGLKNGKGAQSWKNGGNYVG